MNDSQIEMLVDIAASNARIEAKLDTALVQLDDHEQRIRSTEKWRWGIPGAGLLAAFSALLKVHTG